MGTEPNHVWKLFVIRAMPKNDFRCANRYSQNNLIFTGHSFIIHADVVSMFFDGQVLTTDTPRRFFGANSFYTTAAHRMSRHVFEGAVTAEDVIRLYKENKEAAK